MSNFSLTEWRPYAYPDLNIFLGSLTLITRSIVPKSSSGIAMARFTLTGDLPGCTDATCANSLFSLNVSNYGYAKISYNLAGGAAVDYGCAIYLAGAIIHDSARHGSRVHSRKTAANDW